MKKNKAVTKKNNDRDAVLRLARLLLDAGIRIETRVDAPTVTLPAPSSPAGVKARRSAAFGSMVRAYYRKDGAQAFTVTITGLIAVAIALQTNGGNTLTVDDVAQNTDKSDILFRKFGFRDNEIYLAEYAFYPWTNIPANCTAMERDALTFQRKNRNGKKTVDAYRDLMRSIINHLQANRPFNVNA